MNDKREYSFRNYAYKCRCGFELTVSLDYGTPQPQCKCRICGSIINRNEK